MTNLFESEYADKKWCKQCSRMLPASYSEDICPACKELNLFSEVKEYIRENDVRENDVAEHFGLPLRKVRGWIREGRIQYKGSGGKTISSVYCQNCGKPIEFGTFCPECHHLEKLQVAVKYQRTDPSKMRFLDNADEKKK